MLTAREQPTDYAQAKADRANSSAVQALELARLNQQSIANLVRVIQTLQERILALENQTDKTDKT